jgi:hypothetical protein
MVEVRRQAAEDEAAFLSGAADAGGEMEVDGDEPQDLTQPILNPVAEADAEMVRERCFRLVSSGCVLIASLRSPHWLRVGCVL